MTKTKRYNLKEQSKIRIPLGIIMLGAGIVMELTGYLNQATLGTIAFSNWLILTGIIVIVLSLKNYFYPKEYVYDERAQEIVNKASRLTFTALIFLFLTLFIVGMIQPIEVSMSMFASYILFFMIFAYKLSYWHYNKQY